MAAVKRTYKISEETIRLFERVFPSGKRSQEIDRLMRDAAKEAQKEALRRDIIEGLAYMADVNEETMREWASTENDGWPEY